NPTVGSGLCSALEQRRLSPTDGIERRSVGDGILIILRLDQGCAVGCDSAGERCDGESSPIANREWRPVASGYGIWPPAPGQPEFRSGILRHSCSRGGGAPPRGRAPVCWSREA